MWLSYVIWDQLLSPDNISWRWLGPIRKFAQAISDFHWSRTDMFPFFLGLLCWDLWIYSKWWTLLFLNTNLICSWDVFRAVDLAIHVFWCFEYWWVLGLNCAPILIRCLRGCRLDVLRVQQSFFLSCLLRQLSLDGKTPVLVAVCKNRSSIPNGNSSPKSIEQDPKLSTPKFRY